MEGWPGVGGGGREQGGHVRGSEVRGQDVPGPGGGPEQLPAPSHTLSSPLHAHVPLARSALTAHDLLFPLMSFLREAVIKKQKKKRGGWEKSINTTCLSDAG